MASPRKSGAPSCPKCRLRLAQTVQPSLSFICTNCGVSYVGKQAPRENSVSHAHRDTSKQATKRKEKSGNGKGNLLHLPSIKSTSPSSVSLCMHRSMLLLQWVSTQRGSTDINDDRGSSGGRFRRLTNFLSSPGRGCHLSRSGHSSASSSGDNGESPLSERRGSTISTSSEDSAEESTYQPCLTTAAVLR